MPAFRTLLGILLLLVSLSIMGIFIVLPAVSTTLDDVPFVKSTLQSLLCNPGETLTAEYSSYTRVGSYTRTSSLYCTDRERTERLVSGQAVMYGIVGYLVTFLPALVLLIISGQSVKRARMNQAMAQVNTMMSGQGGSFKTYGFEMNIDPAGNVVVRTPDGKVYTGQQGVSSVPDLPERLRQLQTAYDSGLITREEYDAKRAEILRDV